MKPDQKPELVFIMLTSATSVLTRGGVGGWERGQACPHPENQMHRQG